MPGFDKRIRGRCRTGPVCLLLLISVCWPTRTAALETRRVRVEVLSLFRPSELRIGVVNHEVIAIEIDGKKRVLSAGSQAVVRRVNAQLIELRVDGVDGSLRGESLEVRAPSGPEDIGDCSFSLAVPDKLKRVYSGQLSIRARGAVLEAVVTMPLETAVASVVQAESPPGAGIEALKAQAVATRSFLIARQTAHVSFDFCDTTHCQFLRSPPAPDSAASRATKATAGLVLVWHSDTTAREQTLPAMYARSCGGRTRTLREIGVLSDGYPYYSVRCAWCTRHPERWQRQLTDSVQRTERDRLAFNRVHGWAALPGLAEDSNSQSTTTIEGRGVGHGVGLCQLGAAEMARRHVSFRQILEHYYPNTRPDGLVLRSLKMKLKRLSAFRCDDGHMVECAQSLTRNSESWETELFQR